VKSVGRLVRQQQRGEVPGVKGRVHIAASPTDTIAGYSAEVRTSFDNFPGPGKYTICGLNKQSTNTFVTLQVRTDGEI
jgi:hypothetical protein